MLYKILLSKHLAGRSPEAISTDPATCLTFAPDQAPLSRGGSPLPQQLQRNFQGLGGPSPAEASEACECNTAQHKWGVFNLEAPQHRVSITQN